MFFFRLVISKANYTKIFDKNLLNCLMLKTVYGNHFLKIFLNFLTLKRRFGIFGDIEYYYYLVDQYNYLFCFSLISEIDQKISNFCLSFNEKSRKISNFCLSFNEKSRKISNFCLSFNEKIRKT